nr:immunoglobulin heavy chain junction region [Mus musculus]
CAIGDYDGYFDVW